MTIRLPEDLENSVRSLVQSGHYASVDEAMADAARLLIREANDGPDDAASPADPLLGLWQDYGDEVDEIVAEAYRQRRSDMGREIDVA